jgi:hypothetical protein
MRTRKKVSKPDTFIKTLIASAQFGLILLAIIGISIGLFRPSGWLSDLVKLITHTTTTTVLVGLGLTLVVLYYVNQLLSVNKNKKNRHFGNFLFYIMLGIGLFFLFRLASFGALYP